LDQTNNEAADQAKKSIDKLKSAIEDISIKVHSFQLLISALIKS